MSLLLSALTSLLVATTTAVPSTAEGPAPVESPAAAVRPYGLKAVNGFKWGTAYQAVEAGLKGRYQLVERDKTRLCATGEYLSFPNCRLNFFFTEAGDLFRLSVFIPAPDNVSLARHFTDLHSGLSERMHTEGTWEYYETQPAFTQTPVTEPTHARYTDRVNRGPGYFSSHWMLANSLVVATSVTPNETNKAPSVLLMGEWFQIEPASGSYVGLDEAL